MGARGFFKTAKRRFPARAVIALDPLTNLSDLVDIMIGLAATGGPCAWFGLTNM